MKNKIFLKIIVVTILLILLSINSVNAVYQSTPVTHETPQTQNWDTWLTAVRTMETQGGAMGLTETLNGTSATSESNNIDVHMAKGTEYYAVSLLSASGYGNLNNTQKPETSTADTAAENKTGIYYNYDNWEFLATLSEADTSGFSKYYDRYNTIGLKGLTPSTTWHGGTAGSSLSNTNVYNWGSRNSIAEGDLPAIYVRKTKDCFIKWM